MVNWSKRLFAFGGCADNAIVFTITRGKQLTEVWYPLSFYYMTKKLHIGLIGCGRWGRHILRDLLILGCDVTVVSGSEAGRQDARDGGATEIVASVEYLPPVSGLVVATPTSTHAEVIE